MTTKRHNLLRWLMTSILLALAGSALTRAGPETQSAAEQVYDAASQHRDGVATTARSHWYDAEAGGDDVYDNVSHSYARVMNAHAASDSLLAAREQVRGIGRQISEEGGIEKMKLLCYRVRHLGGDDRWLEMVWTGIGEWMG
ncbi:MAG TPA: hypothetical protein ENK43_13420 [Planctomycetes bacterium]|nr:hypothetical protein [Planctomycetota bacterium]